MSIKKTPLKTALFSIPVLLVTVLFPWKNDNNLKSAKKDVVNKTGTAAMNIQYVDLKKFPILRIKRETITDLFTKKTGEKKVHKLVFKFQIDDANTFNPSLNVFKAQKSKGRRYMSPEAITILERVTDVKGLETYFCEITGKYTMGNLELRRKDRDDNKKNDWESILKEAQVGDTYLYFYPEKVFRNGYDRIIYSLSWGGDVPSKCGVLKVDEFDGGLNPSPPADPR